MSTSNQSTIGGFFELELPPLKKNIHSKALALTSGRACVRLIMEMERPTRVFVPFFCCDALFEPLKQLGIIVVFYEVDETFLPKKLPDVSDGEMIIVINYFGIMNKFSNYIAQLFGARAIIDNTHCFFHLGYPSCYSFTSARKHFGVPDGAFLYGAKSNIERLERNTNISLTHGAQRTLGHNHSAHLAFTAHEKRFNNEVQRISIISEKMLGVIDYKWIEQVRLDNFKYLHQHLKHINTLKINIVDVTSPFCYPFIPNQFIDKTLFYENKVYPPTFWNDVNTRAQEGFLLEKDFSRRLIPLPIDHRYNSADMDIIIDLIMENITFD